MVDSLDVLVINAHPDDETRCAGTLAKLRKKGYSLGLLDLTNGEPTNYGNPATRIAEATAAANLLGAVFRKTCDQPNRLLEDSIGARSTVAYWVRRLRPKIVITMAQDVIHPDHIILPRLVENGVFYARLDQWDQYPNPALRVLNELPPHMPNRLFFSVGRAPVNQLQISFIVDTTETINTKIDLLKCYASQMGESMKKNPTGWADKFLSRDAYWGEHIDTKYGEPFLSRRMIGIDDPITAILPVRYG